MGKKILHKYVRQSLLKTGFVRDGGMIERIMYGIPYSQLSQSPFFIQNQTVSGYTDVSFERKEWDHYKKGKLWIHFCRETNEIELWVGTLGCAIPVHREVAKTAAHVCALINEAPSIASKYIMAQLGA